MKKMKTGTYPEIEERIHEEINFYDTITTLTSAMDLISETVIGHHKRTAYIALKLGQQLSLNQKELQKLVISALIHDLGVFYLNQKFSDLKFDQPNNRHAKIGALLLENSTLDDFSDVIYYHHTSWNESDEPAPYLGQLLYIADRIAILILEDKPVLTQQERIKKTINHYSGTKFWPEGVEGFNQLAGTEYFWLDAVSELKIQQKLDNYLNNLEWNLDLQEVMDFSILTGHIIDFRSPFTATHSTGLANISSHLADCFNFSQKEIQTMKIAGYLHDLGKLYVPVEILNKPGKLTNDEWKIMKTHPYYTHYALSGIDSLQTINTWASYHHEKLDGAGYPFHLEEEDLSLGSRIMAVADIFTALTEDRPYRQGMSFDQVQKILNEMSQNNKQDGRIINKILDNFTEFNSLRFKVQKKCREHYDNFKQKTEKIINSTV